jgi:hypothetical protein
MDERAAWRENSGWTRALLGYTAAIALLAGGLTVFAVSGPTPLKHLSRVGDVGAVLATGNRVRQCVLAHGAQFASTGGGQRPGGGQRCAPLQLLGGLTTYWFAPGTHVLGAGEYDQIDVATNDTLIGGPGAILDGQDRTTRRQRIAGPNNPGTGAIEVNNSGSDAAVPGAYNTQSVISANVLTDNWGGVDIYEDSDRFCGTQSDNTSNDYCTLDDPCVYSVSSCTSHDTASATSSQNPDYYDNRWKSQNILVTGNTLNFTAADIGSDCTADNGCGFVGLYAEWGTYPRYDRYAAGEPGRLPGRRLRRQHLQRAVHLRLHVPGRHRELGPVERWLHRPQLRCRRRGSRRGVDLQRVRQLGADHHHDHGHNPPAPDYNDHPTNGVPVREVDRGYPSRRLLDRPLTVRSIRSVRFRTSGACRLRR